MTFAHLTKDREFAVMTKLLTIFGIVEARQMRELFSHLSDGQYGRGACLPDARWPVPFHKPLLSADSGKEGLGHVLLGSDPGQELSA